MRVRLTAGVQRLRLGPVTALAADRSLTGELLDAAGTVTDLRIVRRWTPRPTAPDEEASALARLVHELTLRHAAAVHDRERAEARLAVLEQLRADVLRDIAESAGAGRPTPTAGPVRSNVPTRRTPPSPRRSTPPGRANGNSPPDCARPRRRRRRRRTVRWS
ncbi:hypothetical protein ACFQZC_14140 [Streptacidiphilus monticola]